jgi:hypothetical protein
MTSSRRSGGRRSKRGSAWLPALGLELIALLAIVGVAQPVWFQGILQRLNSTGKPVVEQTATYQINQTYQPYEFSHPMDAYQPPVLAPARLPSHSSSRSYHEPIDVLRY